MKNKKKWWEEFCIKNGIKPTDTVTAGNIFEFFEYCAKKQEEIHEAMLLSEEEKD